MRAFHVAPLIPVLVEQTSDNVGFDLAAFRLLVAFLVAVVVIAIGVDVRRERDPLSVRRPDRSGGAGRDLRDLFFVIAVAVHHPDLAAGGVGNLFPVGRPARRRSMNDRRWSTASFRRLRSR